MCHRTREPGAYTAACEDSSGESRPRRRPSAASVYKERQTMSIERFGRSAGQYRNGRCRVASSNLGVGYPQLLPGQRVEVGQQ